MRKKNHILEVGKDCTATTNGYISTYLFGQVEIGGRWGHRHVVGTELPQC